MLPNIGRYHSRKVGPTYKTIIANLYHSYNIVQPYHTIPFKLTNTPPMYQLMNLPLINRDKESDIRIKLPQVSKHQAVIKVDENGKAFIINLSKTNPTIVNGNSIEDIEITYLTHGDEILIGERQFLYQSSGASVCSLLVFTMPTYLCSPYPHPIPSQLLL